MPRSDRLRNQAAKRGRTNAALSAILARRKNRVAPASERNERWQH
jgi:hypothetical protein